MNWQQLVDVLDRQVPNGSVTTYAQASLWGYGVSNKNQPVGALLRGARNNGHRPLTNRVVRTNGELANLPDGPDQQKQQLLEEGVPFTADGRVDFGRISPVELA
jgi:methylated-DNA-protein-cysteine methyltransferase related protein